MVQVPPAMQALVEASKLDLKENTSGEFPCPRCGETFTAYRTVTGKLAGKCSSCGLTVPKG